MKWSALRIGYWPRILLCAALIAQATSSRGEAVSIKVVNKSSLVALPSEPFAATIDEVRAGKELAVKGRVAERTTAGERLTYVVLQIVLAQADGTVLWSGESTFWPGALDWRLLLYSGGPAGDGALLDRVILRDRHLRTVEQSERETLKAKREARQAELKLQRQREATIKAKGWPGDVERAVIDRKVAVGMNREQVRMAWGSPQKVNQTVRASGVSEQWVYSFYSYVYFESDKVTAIQSTR